MNDASNDLRRHFVQLGVIGRNRTLTVYTIVPSAVGVVPSRLAPEKAPEQLLDFE